MTDSPAPVEYGVTPTEVMAGMTGIDFVRATFDGRLPAPPIMQTIEPFDSSAEPGVIVFHSVPGFRHYNPIGSVHGGYAAILLDSAMGLAVHSALPPGRRASPTPRAVCWRTPPRPAWCSKFPKTPEDNRAAPHWRHDARRWIS